MADLSGPIKLSVTMLSAAATGLAYPVTEAPPINGRGDDAGGIHPRREWDRQRQAAQAELAAHLRDTIAEWIDLQTERRRDAART